MELNELIADYKAVREERERYEVFYKAKLQALQEKIEALMTEQDLQSAKTASGQAVRYVRRSLRVADLDKFLDYAEANAPYLVKKSLENTEALAVIDSGELIPGIEVGSTFVLSIK